MDKRALPRISDWSDLRYFLELARSGSHAAASRRLKVEHTTVARRIARLEAEIGEALFERGRVGWSLTATGHQLLPHAEAMESATLTAAEELGASGAARGTVRLAAPEVLGTRVLTPRLAPLLEAHPELGLELLLLPRSPNLAAREAELAVTIEPPRSGRYVVTRLATLRYVLCASRDYLRHCAPIRSRADLAGQRYVDYVQDHLLSDSLRYLDELGLAPQRRYTATGMGAQFEAIRAGLGLGMLAHYLLYPRSELVAVLPEDIRIERTLWLAAPADLFRLRRVRVVWDAVRAIAEAEPGLFSPSE